MSTAPDKPAPTPEEVLRRMLQTAPQPRDLTTTKEAVDRAKRLQKESAKLVEQSRALTGKKPKQGRK
jgi:hypothetical protein